ncbi:hypothetical protein ACFYXD_35100 [Streptomyces platensis]|uniref:hypothetical protein n=1 Tax=Streptomyces platensis TaxID=58346 RepID=UPI0036A56C59
MDVATRSWLYAQLGTATDLADLETRYTRLGRARAVAIEVLTQRKADLIAQPASVNVSSVVGVTYTENIKALERQILALEAEDAPPAPDEPAEDTSDNDTESGWSIVRLVERPRR